MSNFLDRTTAKLGTKAEDIVGSEFIMSKGYEPYSPAFSGAHTIDFNAFSAGTHCFNLDVKCKSRFVYIPFTGIDKRDVEKYNALSKPTYLLFVDPASCEVYGQWLQKLNHQPSKEFAGGKGSNERVITWPLSGMTHYRYLTETECNELKEYEQSNYR